MIYLSLLIYSLLIRKEKPTPIKDRFEWRKTSYGSQIELRQEFLEANKKCI